MPLKVVREHDYRAFSPKDIDHTVIVRAWAAEHPETISARNGEGYPFPIWFRCNR
jgi:hypothetical protein